MPQPNQYSFTRSQIRHLARSGGLTPETVAKIEDAVRRGQVHDDTPRPGWRVVPTGRRLQPTAAQPPPAKPTRGGSELGGVMQ